MNEERGTEEKNITVRRLIPDLCPLTQVRQHGLILGESCHI